MKAIVCLLITGYFLSPVRPIASGSSDDIVIPASITFERMVVQQMNGEDGKQIMTYYFSLNGDYAAIKPSMENSDSEMSLMVYAKDGSTLMFNDTRKTITVIRATKLVADGAKMSKELAESISHKKLAAATPKKDDFKITPTGKTKNICGYTALEYEMKSAEGESLWYYAKVDFNPIKIYTMGAGSAGTPGVIDPKKAESLKNNPLAIPVLNKNYLLAETTSAGGIKGMETKSISKTTFSVSTTGYKIIDLSKKGLGGIFKSKSKGN